jgi:hypothetical protein
MSSTHLIAPDGGITARTAAVKGFTGARDRLSLEGRQKTE